MDKNTGGLSALIMAVIGGFMVWTNAQYLLNYKACAASQTCSQYHVDSNMGAVLNVVLGALLLWGAWQMIRPSKVPSAWPLMTIACLSGVYLVVMFLSVNGYAQTNWNMQNATLSMIAAAVALILSLKALFRKRS